MTQHRYWRLEGLGTGTLVVGGKKITLSRLSPLIELLDYLSTRVCSFVQDTRRVAFGVVADDNTSSPHQTRGNTRYNLRTKNLLTVPIWLNVCAGAKFYPKTKSPAAHVLRVTLYMDVALYGDSLLYPAVFATATG